MKNRLFAVCAVGVCGASALASSVTFNTVATASFNNIASIDAQGDVGVTTPGWGPPDGPGGGLSGSGGFVAGQTRHFQIFYRDLPTVVCMTGQATSNAARVLFFI